MDSLKIDSKLTRAEKERNHKEWYKEKIRQLDSSSFVNGSFYSVNNSGDNVSLHRNMKINYDLFNNKIDLDFLKKLTNPFIKGNESPLIDVTNKDIISGKIKALLGMEMKRPFKYKAIAVNDEATTRKEKEYFSRIRDFVVNTIMLPIKQKIEQEYAEQTKGKNLTDEEISKINEEIETQLKTLTPFEVKRYMEREHQDPAEILAHQILEYLTEKLNTPYLFNMGFKHGLISGMEVFYIGIVNGEPVLKVVNPLYFDFDRVTDTEFIEKKEWAAYRMYMSKSEILSFFKESDLTDDDYDEIFGYGDIGSGTAFVDNTLEFSFDNTPSTLGYQVTHYEWKALKKYKIIRGIDPITGQEYMELYDESYVFNSEAGDISEKIEWILTKYEGYQVGKDKFTFLQEVPGQYIDIDTVNNCELSYKGCIYDQLNSETVSIVDRMKYYQYMYNAIVYKIETLIASDDGKAFFINPSLIPKKDGMTFEKWLYLLRVNKIGLLDPTQEGAKGSQDVSQAVKEVDLTLISDIQKYMLVADYLEKRCGESVGITKQVEGQISSNEAVRNTQQALIQSASILEPYFDIHNIVKRNVLQSLIDTAKVAFTFRKPKYLNYVLDDFSQQLLNIDYELLENSMYGIFVSNSMRAYDALQNIQQLSHAMIQNQQVEASDILKILKSNSVEEAEELLRVSEKERQEREQAAEEARMKAQADAEEKMRQFQREQRDFEIEKIKLTESLKTEREIQKQAMLSVGFNEDKDMDNDGQLDVLEIAKLESDIKIKERKLDLEEKKLQEDRIKHKDKMNLENKKLNKIENKTK